MSSKPRVLFVPYRGMAVVPGARLAKWKRRAVWGNDGRNARVAELAASLAADAQRCLRGPGVRASQSLLPERSSRRVVVLAETAEHARNLGALLPGWGVSDAVPTEDRGECRSTARDVDETLPPGSIATLMFAAKSGLACGILVRVTAGTGQLIWGSIRSGDDEAGTTAALVVDVADDSCERSRTDSGVRRREYLEQLLREFEPAPKRDRQNT